MNLCLVPKGIIKPPPKKFPANKYHTTTIMKNIEYCPVCLGAIRGATMCFTRGEAVCAKWTPSPESLQMGCGQASSTDTGITNSAAITGKSVSTVQRVKEAMA